MINIGSVQNYNRIKQEAAERNKKSEEWCAKFFVNPKPTDEEKNKAIRDCRLGNFAK